MILGTKSVLLIEAMNVATYYVAAYNRVLGGDVTSESYFLIISIIQLVNYEIL